MEVTFADRDFEDLESDATATLGLPPEIVKSFRKKVNFIRQAVNRLDIYKMRSLRLEKLEGRRQHQHSMRLNDQWRLIVEFEKGETGESVKIISIEDYH